jgi:2-aminoadipate transaminase
MAQPLQTVQISIPPGFIDLGVGDPAFSLLPLDLIRRAAEERLGREDNSFLQYGASQGDGHFRLALSDFLGEGYGFSVDPDQLFVTSGISAGLDLLCTLYTQPGDTVFVEEPSYFLALRIFADHGLKVVSIQTDESGLAIDALEQALKEHRPKFLYVIPTFQNPSGHTLTQERRERLVALSKAHDFLILADEVYHFLSYGARPPKSFGGYADQEDVISLGSFSKILAPGLRLGWIQARPGIVQRLAGCGLLDSGGGLNPFAAAIVRGAIESGGLAGHIARLVETYRANIRVMDSALRRYLPEAAYTIPNGGYFFWVRLPRSLDAAEFLKKAESFKVGFRAGVRFSSQGGLRDYVRLCHAFYGPQEIEEGIRRLKQSIDSL